MVVDGAGAGGVNATSVLNPHCQLRMIKGMSKDTLFKYALALSPDERVELIDDLLQSVVDPKGCPELTPTQQAELIRRLEADRADPTAAISWEEAEKQITGPQ